MTKMSPAMYVLLYNVSLGISANIIENAIVFYDQ